MRTMEVKVFEFKELSKEAKQHALEKLRDINVDDEYWYENVFEVWQEKLAEIGFDEAEIHFSGFCSQGDGACFDADIDTLKIAKHLGYNETELKALEMAQPKYVITKNSYASHYSHYNTRDTDFSDYYNLGSGAVDEFEKVIGTSTENLPTLVGQLTEPEAIELLEARLKSGEKIRTKTGKGFDNKDTTLDLSYCLRDDIEELREDLSRQLYKALNDEYDYMTEDEQVIESIENSAYEFDEDGDTI